MDNLLTILLISVLFLCIIIVIILFVFLARSKNNNNDSINSDLINLNNNINNLTNNTNDKLLKLTESISKVDEAQNSLKSISTDVDRLSRIFVDKKIRGNYGETDLYSLLTNLYGSPDNNSFWRKQFDLTKDATVDAVIFSSNNELISVDSKFPLENYIRLNDSNISDDDKNNYLKEFKRDLKKHIDDISSKYIVDGLTANLAFMYVPSEAMFSYIHSYCYDIIEYSYSKRVYISSPTTLVAYLTAVKNIYLDFKKEENASQILNLLKEFSNEFEKFAERNDVVSKEFDSLAKKYHDLDVTTRKIISKFNEIKGEDNE